MYAIVRSGGRQHKVAVGDSVDVNRLAGDAGSPVELPAVLVVDGGTVTADPASLQRYRVNATIRGHIRGPKIDILRFKNKTGYRRRQGHRQQLTRLEITGIDTGD